MRASIAYDFYNKQWLYTEHVTIYRINRFAL